LLQTIFPYDKQWKHSDGREWLQLTAPALRAPGHTTLSDFGFAVEDGGASKTEPASAAFIAVANSFGV